VPQRTEIYLFAEIFACTSKDRGSTLKIAIELQDAESVRSLTGRER